MILTVFLLLAAGLETGRIVDPVSTNFNPKLSYALYLPSSYTPDRAWPVLCCLDPGARGRLPGERFAKAAEAEGFIVAGSNNSRNGPLAPTPRASPAVRGSSSVGPWAGNWPA